MSGCRNFEVQLLILLNSRNQPTSRPYVAYGLHVARASRDLDLGNALGALSAVDDLTLLVTLDSLVISVRSSSITTMID